MRRPWTMFALGLHRGHADPLGLRRAHGARPARGEGLRSAGRRAPVHHGGEHHDPRRHAGGRDAPARSRRGADRARRSDRGHDRVAGDPRVLVPAGEAGRDPTRRLLRGLDQAAGDLRRHPLRACRCRSCSPDSGSARSCSRSSAPLYACEPPWTRPDDRRRASDAGLRASVSLLRRNRDFRALFFASVISLGGDWFLWVAINSLDLRGHAGRRSTSASRSWRRSSRSSSPHPIGGSAGRPDRPPEADDRRATSPGRWSVSRSCWSDRRRSGSPTCSCPCSRRSPPRSTPPSRPRRPNVVDPEDLPAANALNGSLWGTMLAVGAGLGGLVSAAFGDDTAFLVDAVSFLVSAALLVVDPTRGSPSRGHESDRAPEHRSRPPERRGASPAGTIGSFRCWP